MSELKEYEVRIGRKLYQTLPPIVYVVADDNQPKLLNDKVYLKSEADKMIARHKYKRCLAMTKWCEYFANYWECCEPPDCFAFIARAKFHRKWHKRWLELAEKFKEAK